MVDFKAPYSLESALSFLYNFLPDDFQKFDEEVSISFKPQFIRNIRKIGEVSSLDNLHVYEITHESENDPRVSLSKDSFRLLAHYGVKKALIFFVSQKSCNYRLSLVTVDLKWTKGTKVDREFSNPRRYSFFLGPDAKVHTPYDFLIKRGRIKGAEDLLSRFDVEVVTKEFFTNYKGLFENIRAHFEKDHGFKIFAGKNNIDIDTFAKKLLGQIVFCYFLQRKGWLGAKRGEAINKGDKDFMRSLFGCCVTKKKNLYNDYLEYLFYDSLNNRAEGSSDFYRKHFDCQIPFLNGGLFEPPEDYDWKKSFVYIPDKIFSNKDKTGVLDIFDLYNFTVYEDDPMDREVSVDPEMMGKVFENLLPENLRKGQGAYYTPREIVHYMCQESLINYLITETKIDIQKIRELVVHKKVLFSVNDSTLLEKALSDIKVCDPACGSGAFLVGMLHEIVGARHALSPKEDGYHLKKETIQDCIYGVDIDPGAVEIAKLRLWLSLMVDYELKDIEPLPNLDYKIMCGNSLLEELIIGEESIKLFDEKLLNVRGNKKLETLLFGGETVEHKNAQAKNKYLGNLLKEKQKELFDLNSKNKLTPEKKKTLEQEIKAINKELNPKLKKIKSEDYHSDLFGEKAEKYFTLLMKLHKEYFTEYNPVKKKEKRKQIENIELEFVKSSIKEKVNEIEGRIENLNMQDPESGTKHTGLMKKKLDYMAVPERIHESKTRPYFLWKLNFFEVFQEKGGFDVMVANPPYVGEKGHKEIFREIKKGTLGKFYQGKMDLFYFFFHLALNLGKQSSNVSFISTNYYPTATGAKKLRQDFKERAIIKNLVNFNELKIFESALGQHNMITILKKGQNKNILTKTCLTQRQGFATHQMLQQILAGIDEITSYKKVAQDDLYEGGEYYIRQMGKGKISQDPIQTILDKLKKQGVDLGIICNVNQGILTGADKVSQKHIQKYKLKSQVGEGIFTLSSEEVKALNLTDKEKEILKPWFKNSHINRWYTLLCSSEQIIYSNYNTIDNIENFPSIEKHLNKYKEIISQYAYRWHDLHRSRETRLFESPKIVAPQRSPRNTFGYNKISWYAASDVFFITEKDCAVSLKYILNLINSKLYFLWLYYRGKKKGETLELIAKPLSEIPIKKISEDKQKPFINVVDKILSITNSVDYSTNASKQAKVKEYEHQVDQIVYKLYGLTVNEIKVVEDFCKDK